MTLEIIFMITKIIATVAVILSLIVLTIQLRLTNAQREAMARIEFVRAMGELNMAIAANNDMASVYRRGLDSLESLSEDESLRFVLLMGQTCNSWSVLFQLFKGGIFPKSEWYIVEKDIYSLLSTNGGKTFWESTASNAFHPEFVKHVNVLLDKEVEGYQLFPHDGEIP